MRINDVLSISGRLLFGPGKVSGFSPSWFPSILEMQESLLSSVTRRPNLAQLAAGGRLLAFELLTSDEDPLPDGNGWHSRLVKLSFDGNPVVLLSEFGGPASYTLQHAYVLDLPAFDRMLAFVRGFVPPIVPQKHVLLAPDSTMAPETLLGSSLDSYVPALRRLTLEADSSNG